MSGPTAFRNTKEIIDRLQTKKAKLAEWFGQREDSLEQIAKRSVGGNTFRAFRGLQKQPSQVFRDWACSALGNKCTINKLAAIRTQAGYDIWQQDLSSAFRQTWQEQTGTVLPYGPSRKLPDLLLKHFVWWTGLDDTLRAKLIGFLHVPLDSFTLVGIRNCIADPEIPPDATMKFVSGPTMYNQIQDAIRTVTAQAQVPAIYFDVLAWKPRPKA